MMTKEEVQNENMIADVYTIDEFIELLDMGAIDPYNLDAQGYYHDGEHETTISVWLNRSDILDHKEKYPYILWTQF